MRSQESYVDFLRRLSPRDRTEEIYQELTDSLQELVRAVEHTQAAEQAHVQGCVIDDILIDHIELLPETCVVQLSFGATAELNEPGEEENADRVTGSTEAVFDADGQVTFRKAVLHKERDFAAHDVGGGD